MPSRLFVCCLPAFLSDCLLACLHACYSLPTWPMLAHLIACFLFACLPDCCLLACLIACFFVCLLVGLLAQSIHSCWFWPLDMQLSTTVHQLHSLTCVSRMSLDHQTISWLLTAVSFYWSQPLRSEWLRLLVFQGLPHSYPTRLIFKYILYRIYCTREAATLKDRHWTLGCSPLWDRVLWGVAVYYKNV